MLRIGSWLPACISACLVFAPSTWGQHAATAAEQRLASPSERHAVVFSLDGEGRPHYRIEYQGKKPIVIDSPLGLRLDGDVDLTKGLFVTGVHRTGNGPTKWTPVYGERSEIVDHYHQMAIDLETRRAPSIRLRLVFRAYDEGIALRYEIPQQQRLTDVVITEERTSFVFPENSTCWPVYSAQGVYEKAKLADVKPDCERPLLVQPREGLAISIGEAALVDYARMRLRPGASPFSLMSQLASDVTLPTPMATPWRFVMAGSDPGQLLEHNYFLLNLNAPCAIEDPSWIKPGKVIREVTLTTEGGKACVDFAVANGLQYIEYDAGWYGHEYDEASDATTVTRDQKKGQSGGRLDLEEVIRYAEQRGIGVFVYVNRRQLERQLDEILPLYESWGIRGVKYGFVQVGSQQWTTWLHEAVRKAADHRLMVDIHDEYRPTGYERTYPNLLTQEGIRGNECMPPADHNVTTALTRMLCGAGDYTPCWYTDRVQTTRAHQLATPVVFYSPLTFLYWYDRPAMFRDEPELEFWRRVPVTWDETDVLHARVAELVSIARRSGDTWYIGTLNGLAARDVTIPLAFLTPEMRYRATIYRDADPRGEDRLSVAVDRREVTSEDTLNVALAPSGGCSVLLEPVAP